MTKPSAIGGAGIGLDIFGTMLSAFGARDAGNAKADLFAYQAGIADLRRKIALQNRDFAIQQGGEESVRYGMKSRFEFGNIEAAQSASGLDIGSGSAVAVREGHRRISDIDLATITNNAARRAYGYETEAAYEGAQGELYRMAERQTREAVPKQMLTSLISGASSVSSKWLQGRQVGLWGGDDDRGLGAATDPVYSNYGFNYA